MIIPDSDEPDLLDNDPGSFEQGNVMHQVKTKPPPCREATERKSDWSGLMRPRREAATKAEAHITRFVHLAAVCYYLVNHIFLTLYAM